MTRPDIATEVRRLVRRHAPASWQSSDLHDGLSLVRGGLDLDSVAIVELLVACEERFGIPFPADLLDGPTPTIGKLIDHVHWTDERATLPGLSDPPGPPR